MGQWVNFFNEFKLINVGVVKTSLKERIVKKIRPETKWSNHEQTIEGRTCVCCNMLRWIVIRGERLIKLRDSWFSAKFIEVKRNFYNYWR